jgi:diguanylate cyclase (GGDEF)-like protein/PAS domain S-box-containing protein
VLQRKKQGTLMALFRRDNRAKPKRPYGVKRVRALRASSIGSHSNLKSNRPADDIPTIQAHALRRAQQKAEVAMSEARSAHARLRDAIDILPQGIVFLDREGRYILWNQRYADIYKGSSDLFQVGIRLEDTLRIGVARGEYPDAIGREEEWIAERLGRLRNPGERHEQQLADGRWIMIEERRTSDGGSIGLRVDITEMKQREASFRLLFESNPVPMFLYGRHKQSILAVNDAALKHYGYARSEILGMSLRDIHEAREYAALQAFEGAASDRHAGRTWKHRKADGTYIDVAVFARELTHDNIPAVLIAAIDITERKRAEARVAHMAHHDALTGLPNRVLLRLRMQEALRRARRSDGGFAVLCLDLDNFKAVNDTLGHPSGDALLQQVADRIQATVRQEDAAARLGGDEFGIMLSDVEGPAAISALAERLLAVINEPYDINGHMVLVGVSIGIAIAPGDGDDTDRLLKSADMALYRAKADGKGSFRYFEAEMDRRLQSRRRLEVDLRGALFAQELQVHYQPLVNLATGTVSGLEALLRWPHAERGLIPPSEFIPVAEETGLIGSIGAYVMRRACADAAMWPEYVKLAVNLSPLQFRTGNLLVAVGEALEHSGLSPKRLELEITETLLLERADYVLSVLHALRALGVRISMDDFGTGYSSLSYLRSFPFDKIKIDRSFVRDLGTNADSQAIVRAILSLGASLGISITAEGIETEADLACLRAHGCSEGQGYFFSEPRPQAEILELLAAQPIGNAA